MSLPDFITDQINSEDFLQEVLTTRFFLEAAFSLDKTNWSEPLDSSRQTLSEIIDWINQSSEILRRTVHFYAKSNILPFVNGSGGELYEDLEGLISEYEVNFNHEIECLQKSCFRNLKCLNIIESCFEGLINIKSKIESCDYHDGIFQPLLLFELLSQNCLLKIARVQLIQDLNNIYLIDGLEFPS